MPVLHAHGEGCCNPVRWMLSTLDSVSRHYLCPSTTQEAADWLRWGLDRDTMASRRSRLARWPFEVSTTTNPEPQAKAEQTQIKTEVPELFRRRGAFQRKGQNQRQRMFCAFAALYAVVGSTSDAFFGACRIYPSSACRVADAFPEFLASFAALSKAQAEGGLRTHFVAADVQRTQGQIRFARGCDAGGQECRGHFEKGRCQISQATDRSTQDSTQEAVGFGRAVGSLPHSMGALHRKGISALAFSCGGFRSWRDQVCGEAQRHDANSSGHPPSLARGAYAHDGARCRRWRWRCRHGDCSRGLECYQAIGRARRSSARQRLLANQERALWRCETGQGHHRRQNQRTRALQIQVQKGARRSGDHRTSAQTLSGLRLASCLRASVEEASPACETAVRRAMRRAADRFCKLTFWPIVETEGELPFWHSSDSNFWCVNDNFDRRDGVELRDVPFSEVLPVHTVFEEPDFTSVWDAREKALLLESSLQLPLFEVDFDCISKWWIKTSESGSHFDGGILNESNDFAAARLYGPPDDAPLGIRHESLHDWLEQPRRHRITRPTSHSGTDDREQPLESASSSGSSASRTRRSQASPKSSPQIPWQRSIWEILIHEGRPDIDGEDAPVIFLSSFYLDHVRHRHHYQARPLRFSLDFDNWEDDIRFMWEDHIDPDLSLAVHLVQPQPPAITGGGSLGTLIVH